MSDSTETEAAQASTSTPTNSEKEVGEGLWRKAVSRFLVVVLIVVSLSVIYLFIILRDPEATRQQRSQKAAQDVVFVLRKVHKAVAAYRKEIGDYPIQMEDLVPKYLPSADDLNYESGEGRQPLIYIRPDESAIPDTPILKARIMPPATSVDAPKWDVTISTESLIGGLRYHYDNRNTAVDLQIKPK